MTKFWEVREDPEYYDEDEFEEFLDEIPAELDKVLAEPFSPYVTSNS